ncbi:hypothetical protein Tco_0432216 [Tanacetum coccineum]
MRTRSQARRRRQPQVRQTSVESSNLEKPDNPPIVTMADNRTMAQLLEAPTEGYEDAIVIPEITANNFEIKHGLLNLVQALPQSISSDDADSKKQRLGSGQLIHDERTKPQFHPRIKEVEQVVINLLGEDFQTSMRSGNTTPILEPIISYASLIALLFGDSDFLLMGREDSFLALEVDPILSELTPPTYQDLRGTSCF